MEKEKMILVPLQEWDELKQTNIRLKALIDEERKKFEAKMEYCIVHCRSIMEPTGISHRFYDIVEVRTNESVVADLKKDCDKFRKLYEESRKEVERLEGLSLWEFIKKKL